VHLKQALNPSVANRTVRYLGIFAELMIADCQNADCQNASRVRGTNVWRAGRVGGMGRLACESPSHFGEGP
jgi:hypothetical protein